MAMVKYDSAEKLCEFTCNLNTPSNFQVPTPTTHDRDSCLYTYSPITTNFITLTLSATLFTSQNLTL